MATGYKEINKLKLDFQELQNKHDNQTVLLQQIERKLREEIVKNAELTATLSSSSSGTLGPGSVAGAGGIQSKLTELTSQLQVVIYERNSFQDELKTVKQELNSNKEELLLKSIVCEELQSELERTKVSASQFELAAKDALHLSAQREQRISTLQTQLLSKDEELLQLAADAKMMSQHKEEIEGSRRTIGRLQRQIMLVAENANMKENELQNLLQSQTLLMEELKLEYEDYVGSSKLQWEMDVKEKTDEITRINSDFEQFKLMQFEDKQQILREHAEVRGWPETALYEFLINLTTTIVIIIIIIMIFIIILILYHRRMYSI
jgi:hypothetical protein